MKKQYRLSIAVIPLFFSVSLFAQIPAADTSAVLFDAVRVNAYQFKSPLRMIPGSISVLNSDDLRVSDETNLADALNTIPGVNAQSGNYTTNRIVIRGMGSRTPYNTNRIRIYINDIPFTSSDGLSSPEELDVLSFGRIELVKGPSSALYGSGLGGSLNLYTPSDTGSEVNVGFQYGNYNTWKSNLKGTWHRGMFDIWRNFSHLQSDGYRENSKYQRTSMFNTARWNGRKYDVEGLLLLTRIRGNLPSSLGITQFMNEPKSAAANWLSIKGYKKYFRGLAGISINTNQTSRISNKLIFFGKGIYNYEKRPFNNLKDHSIGAGIRDKVTIHFKSMELVLGTELYTEGYTWALDTSNVRINRNRERRNMLNVFSVWHYHPSSKLNISVAGALNLANYRLIDLFDKNGTQAGKRNFPPVFSPRLGMSYAPLSNLSFYFSTGHGFSLPSPEETLLPEGEVNNNIMPEQGWQFELGTRLDLVKGAFIFDGNIYWIELNNLLVTKRLTEDIFTGINAGKTRHMGVEAVLLTNILRNRGFPGELSLLISYTNSENEFIHFEDDGNIYDGNVLPGIPAQMTYFRIKWLPVKAFSFTGEMKYNGRQYLDDSNNLIDAGYTVANIRLNGFISLKKAGGLNLYVGINNVTDEHYASMVVVNAQGFNNNEPRYYYPGLPRTAYIGMFYSFPF